MAVEATKSVTKLGRRDINIKGLAISTNREAGVIIANAGSMGFELVSRAAGLLLVVVLGCHFWRRSLFEQETSVCSGRRSRTGRDGLGRAGRGRAGRGRDLEGPYAPCVNYLPERLQWFRGRNRGFLFLLCRGVPSPVGGRMLDQFLLIIGFNNTEVIYFISCTSGEEVRRLNSSNESIGENLNN